VQATAHSFFGVDDLEQLHFAVPLRGAAMYGLARADRGLVQDRLLAAGDEESLREFGRLLSIAHDGDRLFQFRISDFGFRISDNLQSVISNPPVRPRQIEMEPYHGHHERLTDAALEELIRRTPDPGPRTPDPGPPPTAYPFPFSNVHSPIALLEVQLRRQPGFYGASIADLDLIVDLTQEVEGVLGAGLMGAGGGGIVEVLARAGEEVYAAVQDSLAVGYYGPRGWSVPVERWRSVAAASRLEG
jgi:hypothetical protein